MKNRYSFQRLFDGNPIVLMCVFYTISIKINAVSRFAVGEVFYIDFSFFIWSMIFLTAPILPIEILKRLWKSDYINDRDYLFWAGIPMYFVMSCGLALFYTFLQSLFEPLPPNAYFYTFINYTTLFVIITIGAIVIDLMLTARDNKNLKKIQAKINKI